MSIPTLELDAAAFDALTPAERQRFLRLWEIAYPPSARWYCDRATCDGNPHPGWHWCEHPIGGAVDPHLTGGEEFRSCRHARDCQRPPVGDWGTWLFLGGRGTGKTQGAAWWIVSRAQSIPNSRWLAVARTGKELHEDAFEGESGILAAAGVSREDPAYNISAALLRLPNGSLIQGRSADEPKGMRGPNFFGAWLDELVTWKSRQAYDDLLPAVRRGRAQVMITTTPAPTQLLVELVAKARQGTGDVVMTHGSMFDNERNLSKSALERFRTLWQGRRQERQELYGELLEDVPGALWTPEMIERTRGPSLREQFAARYPDVAHAS